MAYTQDTVISFVCSGLALSYASNRLLTEGMSGRLAAKFDFDASWDGKFVHARFSRGADEPIDRRLLTGVCEVPWEVVFAPGFDVSVWYEDGDATVASTVANVPVRASGAVAAPTPTPSLSLLEQVEKDSDEAAAAAGEALERANAAAESACRAECCAKVAASAAPMEAQRQADEEARRQAEDARVLAEKAREAAEAQRRATEAAMKESTSAANSAADAAKSAASSANAAATAANAQASLAQAAAAHAESAAALASDAAKTANDAADRVSTASEDAAKHAEQAAAQAEAAASRADAAADNAAASSSAAADLANQAVANANAAYGKALSATAAATAGAESAEKAAANANAAALNVSQALKWNDNVPFGTLEGEGSAIVGDAFPAEAVSLSVYGKSEQVQTTGKNLVPTPANATSNGVTLTNNADGSFTLSGTSNNGGSGFTGVRFAIEDGTYTLSSDIAVPSGVYISINNTAPMLKSPGRTKTDSIAANASAYMYIWVDNGTTVNSTFKVQLEAGTAATSYEPYTGGKPSPSPDYPQPIDSVGDLALVDYAVGDGKSEYIMGTASGGVIEYSFLVECGTYGVDVTSGSYAGGNASKTLTPVSKPAFVTGRLYVVETDVVGCTMELTGGSLAGTYGESSRFTFEADASSSLDSFKVTFTGAISSSSLPHAHVYVYEVEPVDVSTFSGDGSAGTSTRYLQASATDAYPLRSLPDGTRDELHVDGEGNVTLVQRVGEIVIDGSTGKSVFLSTSGDYQVFGFTLDENKGNGHCYCDRLISVDSFYYVTDVEKTISASTEKRLYMNFGSSINTEDEANELLSSNPITVNYPLATPVTVPLGTVDTVPALPATVSRVEVSGTPAPDFRMRYVQSVDALFDGLAASVEPLYGIRHKAGATSWNNASWERTYDAVGRTFAVSTDEFEGYSDFDGCGPFEFAEVKGTFDADGTFREKAVKGTPGYDALDAECYCRFRNSYWMETDDETVVSLGMFPGSHPFLELPDGTVPYWLYIPQYKMSKGADGAGHSKPGAQPDWGSYATHKADCVAAGPKCHTGASWYENFKRVMCSVEFGARDVQNASGMQGFSTGIYSERPLAASGGATNTATFQTESDAGLFVVGQTVNICTGWISSDVASNRHVTAVDASAGTVSFDGDPVEIAEGMNMYNMDWRCGSTSTVKGHTGQKALSGKYQMKWRGIEDVWGGSAEDICDLRLKTATVDGATRYTALWCPDPVAATLCSSGAPDDGFVDTGLLMPAAYGYVKFGQGSQTFPAVFLPREVGAASNTYYGDYYWFNTAYPDDRAVRSGLGWLDGSYLGVFCRNCNLAPSDGLRTYAARLFFTV